MSQAGPIDVIGGNPSIPTEFIADIGSAVPIGNILEVLGTTQAAASSPLHTTGSGNTLTIIAQRTQAIAASDATKVGLAAFDSADFTVDANGFVSFSGTGGTETLTGNTGGAISPVANNINTIGDGSITISGAGNTLTTQLTGLTNHAVLVGAGTTTITKVGPTATAGQVLQSAGAAADPAFSTATYPSTTTINQILYSSATNVISGLATANRGVLTTGATGVPVITALAIDGQVIIGSTAGVPAAATLTAGTGISITNASNSITIAVNGSIVGETITGNTGGAISPSAGNWNTLGTGSITIAGAGSTLTTQLTGLTNHSVQVGAGTATLTQLAVGTNGQVLIGASTADPAFATLTSSDSSISFTTGANTLSLQVAGGATTIKTITGNTGGAESPSAGNFNILGTGSITVEGTANTETVQLTGLTNHAIQIGAGTATLTQLGAGTTGQILQTNTGADPTWSTATYPSTATGTGKVLIADGTNWVASTPTFPNASATSGKIIQSDGTNWIASTPTYPSTAGTSGNILTSDGTNWTSAPNASVLLSATGTLTSAQVKAIHATPITAIAAPGAGKVIVPISVASKLNYGGSNVFVAGASQSIGMYYTTAIGIGNNNSIMLNSALVLSATSTQIYSDAITSALILQTSTSVENKPIILYNPVATEISGNAANNNTVTWQIIYYISTL